MDTTYAFIGMLTILFMGSVLSKEAFTDGQVTVSVTMPSCDSATTGTPEYDINYSDTTNHINYSDLTNNMYSDSRTVISVTDLMGMANSSCPKGSVPAHSPARSPGTAPGTAPAPSRAAPSTAAPIRAAPSTAAPIRAAPSTAAPIRAAPSTAPAPAPSRASPGGCPSGQLFHANRCIDNWREVGGSTLCPSGYYLHKEDCIALTPGSKGYRDDYETSGSFGDSGKYCESDSQCINSCDFTVNRCSSNRLEDVDPSEAYRLRGTGFSDEELKKFLSGASLSEAFTATSKATKQGKDFVEYVPINNPASSEYIRKDQIPCWACSL